ncbi:MAG: diacylglycerol kinase [Pseudomonadota bacterium]|jgi:diacylglycerol kinase (ATP)
MADGAGESRGGNLVKRRLFDASRYSLQGLRACFRHEEAFRTELVLALILTPLAFWVARSALELVLLLGVMVLVLIVELLNSAVESVVDLHGRERRELAGRAKDQGSAAVMLSMALCILVWGGVLWGRFIG